MITKQEVLTTARTINLSPYIVEKDYVLSWILGGIAMHRALNQALIFKGGTCLKKCFFQSYRFSEDLDFTINHSQQIDKQVLLDSFTEICEWVYDLVGIEIPVETLSFELTGTGEQTMVTGKLNYLGPLQRQRGGLSGIKIDISLNEKLVCPPEQRPIHHPYTDSFDRKITINSYCIEEIFAEKFRALADRLRPRDLYDVIALYRIEKKLWQPEAKQVLKILQAKCSHKNIPLPTLELLVAKPEKTELISEWENMLAHQISFLQPFEDYWQLLPQVFEWLYAAK